MDSIFRLQIEGFVASQEEAFALGERLRNAGFEVHVTNVPMVIVPEGVLKKKDA